MYVGVEGNTWKCFEKISRVDKYVQSYVTDSDGVFFTEQTENDISQSRYNRASRIVDRVLSM